LHGGAEKAKSASGASRRRLPSGRPTSNATEAAAAWQKFIVDTITAETMRAARSIGVAVAESFSERDEAIRTLQRRLDRLDTDLSRLDALVAKLNLRVVEGELRDRKSSDHVPPPSSSRELN